MPHRSSRSRSSVPSGIRWNRLSPIGFLMFPNFLMPPSASILCCSAIWFVGDRWGKVGALGVTIPLRLSHSLLAELLGARRSSVTLAVGELERHGRVSRAGGRFTLHGSPPEEMTNGSPVSRRGLVRCGQRAPDGRLDPTLDVADEARPYPGPGACQTALDIQLERQRLPALPLHL